MTFLGESTNLEYRALLQENGTLTGGIRYGIETLCQNLYSKELLAKDIYKLSLGNADDLTLSKKVVNFFMERVKNDHTTFKRIVEVLHDTVGMEHLAKGMEEKLASLQTENAQNMAYAQLVRARQLNDKQYAHFNKATDLVDSHTPMTPFSYGGAMRSFKNPTQFLRGPDMQSRSYMDRLNPASKQEEDVINLEHIALLQESGTLTEGIRYIIKTICRALHSKELLDENIFKLSLGNADDLNLPKKVVNSLLERVRKDHMAFREIVEVFHQTIGMEHLAKRMEDRLASLQEPYVARSLAVSPPTHALSPHMRAFQKNYKELFVLRFGIGFLSAKMYESGLISRDLRDMCSHDSISDSDRTKLLLDQLEKDIEFNPSVLQSFVDILRRTSQFEHIGEKLFRTLNEEDRARPASLNLKHELYVGSLDTGPSFPTSHQDVAAIKELRKLTKVRETDNLESQAIHQESDILLLHDIKQLKIICAVLHSKELLPKGIYIKSLTDKHDLTLPYEIVNALLKKVKNDQQAFDKIMKVLRNTPSFEQIATRLRVKLVGLQGDERQNIKERSQANYEKGQRVFQRVIMAKCVISISVVIFNYLGLPRSGKTTLRRRIMGEILNLMRARLSGETEQPSTGVVEDGGQVLIKPSCVEMGTIKSRIWSVVKSLGDEVNMLNQLFYNTIRLPATPLLMNPQILSTTSDHSSREEESKSGPFVVTKIMSAENSERNGSGNETVSTTPLTVKANEESLQDEDMLTILKDIMETDHWEEVKDLFEDTILVSNNDTGGQAEFLDLQAALIQGPSFNLFFSRLHDNLDKVFEVYYTNERGESSAKEDSTMTTEEAMYQALANITCFGGAFTDHMMSSSKKKGSQSVNASSKAMFVCTHMDKVNEEMRKIVFTEKDKLLQKKIEKTEFYERDIIAYASENQLMLPVDNLNGGEDEIKKIQEIFMREIEKSFSNRIDIPASWLILSLYLRKNFSIVSIEKCEEIANKLGIDLEELQDALWFLHHRVGVILYYPEVEAMRDTVICKMQVVFDSASNLIRNTFTFNKVGQRLTNKFKQKGQFSLSDIKDATAQHTDLIPLEKLVKLFQHLNIIATIRPTLDSLSEPTYFMPCVLQSARASELNVPSLNTEDPAPLLLHYDCGYVPVGIFPALITNLVSQRLEGWELIEDGLCKNRVQFHIGDDYDVVTFISTPRHFEIVVSRPEEFEQSTETLCAYIRSVFHSTLQKVTSAMNYHFSMGYQFAFECPAHPGKEHLCILPKENAAKMLCQQNPRRRQPIALQQCHKVWFSESPASQVQSLDIMDPKGSQLSAYLSSLPDDALLYLDKLLDWDQDGVDRHLSKIADTMIDWEEKLSISMALTAVQIHDLKTSHRHNPILLRRAILKEWKVQQGLKATYRNLLKLCCEGGDTRTAETICKVLREKSLDAAKEGNREICATLYCDQSPTEHLSLSVNSTERDDTMMSLDEQNKETKLPSNDHSDYDDEFLTPCGSFEEPISQPAALADIETQKTINLTHDAVDYSCKGCLLLQEELSRSKLENQKDLLKLQEEVQEKLRQERRDKFRLQEELTKLEAENKKLRQQLNSRNKHSEQQVLLLKDELYQRNVEHSAALQYVLKLEKTISQLKAERHYV